MALRGVNSMTTTQKYDIYTVKEAIKNFGKLKIAKLVNSNTGDSFKTCAFQRPILDDEGKQVVDAKGKPAFNVTFCGFAQRIGELTPQEIKDRIDELQVLYVKATGKYKLTTVGGEAWEDVDIDVD